LKEEKLWRVLGIPGSTRANSVNHLLLNALGKIFADKILLDIYDGIGSLPQFNPDDDRPEVLNKSILQLRELIEQADGIIICTPEYAHGVPGTLKNAIDWTVSSSGFYGKPTALITASTDGSFGHRAMLDILSAIGALNVTQHQMVISFVKTKISKDGEVTDETTLTGLKNIVLEFMKTMGNNRQADLE
jgi:NAD(P)H-dependent FMN reductase